MYTTEFQKSGLPHMHILVWLAGQTESSSTFIDSLVSTELPDISVDPLGYALVEEFMMHGPCGGLNKECPYMKEEVFSKRYPKCFHEETTIDESGFPIYRRRDNGRFMIKNGARLNNRWVVPHNLDLLKKYQAHINVEWCNKTNLIKYLFKYVTKGHDLALMFVAASVLIKLCYTARHNQRH